MRTFRVFDGGRHATVGRQHLNHMLMFIGGEAQETDLLSLERFQSMGIREIRLTSVKRGMISLLPRSVHPRGSDDIKPKCHGVLILGTAAGVADEMGNLGIQATPNGTAHWVDEVDKASLGNFILSFNST